mgnify:CR=1 FL=1
MERYCNNCGNTGHYYKDCKLPILSYGIILYDDSEKNNIIFNNPFFGIT